MLHLDIKRFACIVNPGHRITGNPRDEIRGAGWKHLFIAIDDHSRIAFTAMYPNQKATSIREWAYARRYQNSAHRRVESLA